MLILVGFFFLVAGVLCQFNLDRDSIDCRPDTITKAFVRTLYSNMTQEQDMNKTNNTKFNKLKLKHLHKTISDFSFGISSKYTK